MAGVSTATVSRVLNLPDRVKAPTRERVEAAVAALGYTPHFGGRALASNRTNTIGAVIPTMDNAIFAKGLQALQDALFEVGSTLLVASSHYNAEREVAQVRALLARGVDGIALIGRARDEAIYDLMRQRGVPLVLLWSSNAPDNQICSGFDNRAAAQAMAESVLAKGHRRIAMIGGRSQGNDRAAERIAGVRDALSARDIDLTPPYLVEVAYELEASTAAAQELLALSPSPTAIICGNDVIAVGAMRGVRLAGLAVPDDVSIVGYDDIDLATAIEPQLTTVRVPHKQMGTAGAHLLRQMIGGETVTSQLFDFEIVHRGTLAPPPKVIR